MIKRLCIAISCLLLSLVYVQGSYASAPFINIEAQSTALPSPLPTILTTDSQAKESQPSDYWLTQIYSHKHYQQSLAPGAKAAWYKLRLVNNSSQPLTRHLVFDVHILRQLSVYLYGENGSLKQTAHLGIDQLESNQSTENYIAPHVRFEVGANSQLTLLIFKHTQGPGVFPARILSTEEWQKEQSKMRFFWGAVIAVLIALAIYNAMVYSMHPNKSYLWYLSFHLVCFLYFSGLNGFGFLLWPIEMQKWLSTNIIILNFVLIFIVANFSVHFLNAQNNAPTHYRLLKYFNTASIVGFLACFIFPEYQMLPIFSLLQIIGSIYGISMGIVAYKRSFNPAKYFLFSWFFVLLGAAIGMLTFMDKLPITFVTLHAFLFGTLCELFLLSLGLASRMKYFETSLLSQSYIYPNTELGNFSYFTQQLTNFMPKIIDTHQNLYLVLVATEGFKEIVSLYGPNVLSESYRKRTDELRSFLASQAWAVPMPLPTGENVSALALPGEQILLLVDAHNGDDLSHIMAAISEHGHRDIVIKHFHMPMKIRIGYTHVDHYHNLQEHYRKAQVALQSALSSNSVSKGYSPKLDQLINDRTTLLQQLQQAIYQKQLKVYLQPQFSLHNGQLSGAEALVRWQQADGKFISPGLFIPLAEQSGLIFEVSKYMIEHSFAWLGQLKQNSPLVYEEFNLSINLSALDMSQPSLLTFLQGHLFYYGIDANHITLEITESAIMENHDLFVQGIRQLQTLGFHLSIDDFGTGYSSMLYLQELAAKEVKIDMGFIRDIHLHPINQQIVRAIIQLANATDSIAVAEGVECQEEAQWLRQAGCFKAQGFYWSPGLPLDDFTGTYVPHIPR
ncbi:EAL domain-containing protein [Bermanella sp. R86510]|uniref:EAL domain-containing protein n=1 Tax=unclassified Bermanella TaxID=2627862 RepID=UPI0037C69FF7